MRTNRKYTPEFKIQCVKDVLEGRKSITQVADENDFRRGILQQWIKHFSEDGEEYFFTEHRGSGTGCGKGNHYAALYSKKNLSDMERLELENLKLRIENERLKKGYTVKGVGANKEFVTFKDKNT
ncbi:MAG: transposase [Clostridiales bacterium]|nr:transposase [Clostridiales bacterium]